MKEAIETVLGENWIYICYTLNTAKYHESVRCIGTSANTPIRRVIFRVFKYNIFIMYACANLILATTIFLELNQ